MGNKKHEISILGFLQSIPISYAPTGFGKSVNSFSTVGEGYMMPTTLLHAPQHGFSVITMALM